MPPKAKISEDMIIDAAFQIVQSDGADKVTARSISERLNCSTQPVLYYFSTVDEIKKAVYQQADQYHTGYIMNMEKDYGNPFLAIGINYIRFAVEEPHLFRFLFQSNEFSGAGLSDLIQSDDLAPVLEALRQEIDTTLEEAREIFSSLFIFVHGYASLYANNSMVYEEKTLIETLTKLLDGIVYAVKEDSNEEDL